MEEKGKFPPRVPLAGKSYVWPEEEIDAWLENKRAARDEAIVRHEAIGRVPS
jgi:predicted DNA-binding transcriptional regulator AlpA